MIPKPTNSLEWDVLRQVVVYKEKKMYRIIAVSLGCVCLRTVGNSSSKGIIVPLSTFFETYSIFNNTAIINLTL